MVETLRMMKGCSPYQMVHNSAHQRGVVPWDVAWAPLQPWAWEIGPPSLEVLLLHISIRKEGYHRKILWYIQEILLGKANPTNLLGVYAFILDLPQYHARAESFYTHTHLVINVFFNVQVICFTNLPYRCTLQQIDCMYNKYTSRNMWEVWISAPVSPFTPIPCYTSFHVWQENIIITLAGWLLNRGFFLSLGCTVFMRIQRCRLMAQDEANSNHVLGTKRWKEILVHSNVQICCLGKLEQVLP